MPFQIIRDDITRVSADAIVNTANHLPRYVSGTDYAIYQAAGAEELLNERKKIGEIRPGEVAATPAFNLPAKYILHTVGPIWNGGDQGELETLASCYRNCLNLAADLKCESIAFPMISTGVFGFPKDRALETAIAQISAFLMTHEMLVILVVFDKTAFELSGRLFEDVDSFVDDHYVEERHKEEYSVYVSGALQGTRPQEGHINDEDYYGEEEEELRREESTRWGARARRAAGKGARKGVLPNLTAIFTNADASPAVTEDMDLPENCYDIIYSNGSSG